MPFGKSDYVVVFLSDGRPGDMPPTLPALLQESTSYKSHGVIYPSMTAHLRELSELLGSRLQLYTVQFCFVDCNKIIVFAVSFN